MNSYKNEKFFLQHKVRTSYQKNLIIRPIQNGMGEELNPSKKFIKVREAAPSGTLSGSEEVLLLPTTPETAFRSDSQWTIVSFGQSFISTNFLNDQKFSSENEEEIKITDLQNDSGSHSFLLLYPNLQQAGIECNLTRTMSTTNLPKLLRSSSSVELPSSPTSPQRRNAFDLTALTLNKEPKSDKRLTKKKEKKPRDKTLFRPRANSNDADVSDNEDDEV